MDKDLEEKLKCMEKKARNIKNDMKACKKDPHKVAVNALKKLNIRQLEECMLMSAIIAVKKRKDSAHSVAYNNGKLRGYLHCLYQLETLNWYEEKALYEWLSEEDRSSSHLKE